jgi:hypothetical protein
MTMNNNKNKKENYVIIMYLITTLLSILFGIMIIVFMFHPTFCAVTLKMPMFYISILFFIYFFTMSTILDNKINNQC